MKRILTISFTIVLLAGMFVLLGFIRNEHSNAVCRNIRISVEYNSNDTLVCHEEIHKLITSRFDTLEGRALNGNQLLKAKEVISAIPYIESSDVDFLLNGTLRIRAKQRLPVLRIIANGKSWFIDEKGVAMPRHHSFSARVPVASGNLGHTGVLKNGNDLRALADTNTSFAKGRLNQVITLANYIHNDKRLSSMVEQIYVNTNGEIELFTYVGNQRIIFGEAENIEEKFNKLLIFYRSGPTLSGLNKYKTIDLKYNNQVVCSKI